MKNLAISQTSQLQTLTDSVFQVAQNNPSGFTINLNTMQPVTSGIVAAYKATQNSFGVSGLKNVILYATLIGSNFVGGWYNSANDMFYFDAVNVFQNLDEAATFGIENEQIAIFDLNENKEIQLS